MYVYMYVYIDIYIFMFVKVKFSHIFSYLRGFCTLFVLTLVSSSCIYLSLLSIIFPCSTIIALSSTRIIILSGGGATARAHRYEHFIYNICELCDAEIYMHACIYVCMHACVQQVRDMIGEYLTNQL